MKKLMFIVLTVFVAFTLSACSKGEEIKYYDIYLDNSNELYSDFYYNSQYTVAEKNVEEDNLYYFTPGSESTMGHFAIEIVVFDSLRLEEIYVIPYNYFEDFFISGIVALYNDKLILKVVGGEDVTSDYFKLIEINLGFDSYNTNKVINLKDDGNTLVRSTYNYLLLQETYYIEETIDNEVVERREKYYSLYDINTHEYLIEGALYKEESYEGLYVEETFNYISDFYVHGDFLYFNVSYSYKTNDDNIYPYTPPKATVYKTEIDYLFDEVELVVSVDTGDNLPSGLSYDETHLIYMNGEFLHIINHTYEETNPEYHLIIQPEELYNGFGFGDYFSHYGGYIIIQPSGTKYDPALAFYLVDYKNASLDDNKVTLVVKDDVIDFDGSFYTSDICYENGYFIFKTPYNIYSVKEIDEID